MILAERLCLLALDPGSGAVYPACDVDRFPSALSALMLVDLIGSGRFVRNDDRLEVVDTMPLAHPLLAEAAARLARLGPAFSIGAAMTLLAGAAARWRSRIRDGLVARDVLELSKSFPFKRRYRLRSRQAWNECVDPLKALATRDAGDDATRALAIAIQHVAILAEVMDATTARALTVQISSAANVSDETAWLDRLLDRSK